MANQMDLVTKFIPLLNDVYRQNAKSSILEAPDSLVKETEEAKTVKINKFEMDGLGDYSRQSGYSTGNIISTWEYWTFQNDRGRRFNLDKMDNLESLSMPFLNVAGQFMKHHVIPEKDAYTFSAIAGADGVHSESETLTQANIKNAIDRDITALGEEEVDDGNLLIFITPTQKANLENAIGRSLASGETSYGQKLNYYNEIPIITVPNRRFYDKIDLLDGKTSGEEAGGYRKHVATGATGDVAGVGLNYIIMDKNAAVTITKNDVAQVLSPDNNPFHDGWTFSFRFYYDTFLFDNRKVAVRVSKANA